MSDLRDYPRRAFLKDAALGLAVASIGTTLGTSEAADAASVPTDSDAALERLLSGNARFVADRPTSVSYAKRRVDLEASQSPFAVILSCSDSRVPLATIFDQTLGMIFGVRIAGNFADDNGLGSIEYAIAVLRAPLVVVLGHTNCGAVGAAVKYVKDGTQAPGHIQGIVEAIAPAASASKSMPGDWVSNAIVLNVKNTMAAVTARSTIISDAVHAEKLAIVGGIYNLASGKVALI